MAKVMYQGLNRRETYEEILGYLERGGGAGVDISLPDRQASFIRASPQYQNLLTYDFIDLQNQQENMLKQQKREIMVKEQSSGSNASMKSIIASSSPAESVASEQVQSDFNSISTASERQVDIWAEHDDMLDDMKADYEEKTQRMAVRGKAGMVAHVDAVTKLADTFKAAKATGTEPFVGTTGNKLQDKFIKDGQDLDTLRVVEGNNPPPYISEISKDKEAVERFKVSHGLIESQASSSSGPVQINKEPGPEPRGKGRPINLNSARQKALAKAAAKK